MLGTMMEETNGLPLTYEVFGPDYYCDERENRKIREKKREFFREKANYLVRRKTGIVEISLVSV